MRTTKQADYAQWAREEVRRSKRWRETENYEDDWKRFIDLYKGRQYGSKSKSDQLIVNLIFSTINTIAPSVSVNNPKFIVNARKNEQAPQAIVTEEVLNYLWSANRYQDDFRLAVNDWLVVGHGWCKVGYKFTKPPEEKKVGDELDAGDENANAYGIDDRDDIEGNVESEMYVSDDRPFLERISPFDMFVDPDARHPKELCWIAQRTWRPLADVRVDSRYQPAARKKASARSWSRWNTGTRDGRDDDIPNAKQFCEIVEFYDIKRQKVCTFALDSDGAGEANFLIKPTEMPYAKGHPFEMIRNFEVADNFYPMGDVQQIESLQLELNQTRTQMMNHRKRFQRKWLYERDAFDRDSISALESDIDNTMIPVTSDGNPSQVIAPMPAVITPTDFYDQSGLITNDIDRVSGVSDYQRGAAQTAVKRTATEAAMIQDAANARAQDRLRKIESTLARIGERLVSLMQQYMTGEQVARVVTMPGRVWINYDADYLQGDFDFDVAAGSTEPMNETFRRQSALQLVDASMPFLEMGVANPVTLYMQVLQKGFGIKDAQPFIQPQAQQAGGMPPEQQDAPPPQPGDPAQQEMQGAPPQGMPPQGGPPGMPPEMMQQGAPMPPGMMQGPPPQGPPPMDPAMMQQLMAMLQGGGAPPPPPPMNLTDPNQGDMAMDLNSIPPELLAQLMGTIPPL